MLRFAVCDDQFEIAKEIKEILFEFAKEKEFILDVELFSDGKELLESKKKYDLIFLDIEMKNLNGIETARKIRKYDMNVPIVYITSHSDYCKTAYKVHAFEFIIKPFAKKDIFNVMDDFLSLIREKDSDKIELNTDNGIVVQNDNDIYYFICCEDKRKIIVHTIYRQFIVKGNLTDIFNKLDKTNFYMPHRCCIVNLKYVATIENYYDIIMTNGDFLPLSQKKRVEFKEKLHRYMRNKM